jgi:hypothetical protein
MITTPCLQCGNTQLQFGINVCYNHYKATRKTAKNGGHIMIIPDGDEVLSFRAKHRYICRDCLGELQKDQRRDRYDMYEVEANEIPKTGLE